MNYDKFSVCLSSLFASISLYDIENVLNIVILVLSIVNILIVLFSKIYNKLKDGKLTKEEINEIKNDIQNAINDVEQVKKGVK